MKRILQTEKAKPQTPDAMRFLQPLQRLAESELDHVPVRITHGGEIPYDAPDIGGWFDQDVLFAGERGDPIDFITGITLEAEMIEARFDLFLHYDQDERGIFA